MWGLANLIMDAEELFLWLKQRDYCESAYDGRIRMQCDVLKGSIVILHDAERRRKFVSRDFPHLREDDAWCKSEVKRIRGELDRIKAKVGFERI